MLGGTSVAENGDGVSAQTVAVGLPNSRAAESEADLIGIELAARAGYDPRASATLWQKMEKAGGSGPAEFVPPKLEDWPDIAWEPGADAKRLDLDRVRKEDLASLQPGDRVLELGAGLGIVGAVTAKNAGPAAVLSFEANPELIPHIRALHRTNGLEDLIELRNAVLVAGPDRSPTLPFNLHGSFLGSSLAKPPGRRSRTSSVAVRTLSTSAPPPDAPVE